MPTKKLIAFAVKTPYCAPGKFMVMAPNFKRAKEMCEESKWGPNNYVVTYAKREQIIEWED
jgi:hypothetical protein